MAKSNIKSISIHRDASEQARFKKFLTSLELDVLRAMASYHQSKSSVTPDEVKIELDAFAGSAVRMLQSQEITDWLERMKNDFPQTNLSLRMQPAVEQSVHLSELDELFNKDTGRIALRCNRNKVTVIVHISIQEDARDGTNG